MTNDIPWATPSIWGNEEKYVVDALRSTWISGGEYVDRFEREFSRFCGSPHVLAVANGTAALHLVYLALGIGPGDEIIVPGFAFMAAANMARMVGATPVFADVDRDSWCVTADSIAACVTPKTRAIVPVHTYGNVCDMDAINTMAVEKGLIVIEDAAEAIGSSYKGRAVGSLSSIGVFSFHATKTITTGEGGAVTTNDPALADRMRLFRSHGMARKRYWHEVAGHNFRLTNLQAAIGCAQLEQIERIVAKREHIYDLYSRLLRRSRGLVTQVVLSAVSPVMWAIAVTLDAAAYPQGRDQVMEDMLSLGIETRPGFYPASAMHHLYGPQELPVSDGLGASILVLPSSPSLDDDSVVRVCDALIGLAR